LIDGPERRDPLHDVAASAVRADRQTAADDLAERGQVGRNAEALLRAAIRQPKAGHDFVEHQQRAVRLGQLARKLQKSGRGRHRAHVADDRLEDQRRDPRAAGRQQLLQRLGVVQGKTVVVPAMAAGTPALSGSPNVARPLHP
jgi:hypothetical protein